MRWIGVGLGALFVATVAMLVRSARGATSDTSIPSLPIADAKRLTPEWTDDDFATLAVIAKNLKASPADLLLVLASESDLHPWAASKSKNEDGSPVAVGLNQITRIANASAGITEEERQALPKQSVAYQLPLVQRTIGSTPWSKAGKAYDNAGVLYATNFAPSRLFNRGSSLSAVLYEKDKDGIYYDRNAALDVGKKGKITIGDMVARMRAVAPSETYRAGLTRLRLATKNPRLVPNLPGGA